jgi:hypothetical protein
MKKPHHHPTCKIQNFSVAEGWLRLGLKTPNLDNRYPGVLNDDLKHPARHTLPWVDLKNDTQAKALENKPFFDPHRLNT